MLNDLWRYILEKSPGRPCYFFADLADPAKRSDKDLKEALDLLSQLNKKFSVILGVNLAEAERIAKTLKIKVFSKKKLVETLFHKLSISILVLHDARFSYAINKDFFESMTPIYNPQPKIITGAGDYFNAGFCHALLQELPLKEALACGNKIAGSYIKNVFPL